MCARQETATGHDGGPVATGRAIVALAREARLPFVAAATAYYAFVSIFPLALLVVAVGTLLGGQTLTDQLIEGVAGVLSPSGQSLLAGAITGAGGRSGATIVGAVGLLWSGLRVFRGLDQAFATVYGTVPEHGFLGELRDALVSLGALAAGVIAVVAGHLALARVGLPLGGVPDVLVLTLGLTVALAPLYVVFPDVPVSLRTALPGAVVAAVGWALLSQLFAVYAAYAAVNVYGVVAGALLFVTWLYLGAQILLAGAVVNAVLGDRDRQLQLGGDPRASQSVTMTGTDGTPGDGPADDEQPDAPEATDDRADELEELRAELDRLETEIDDRTVHREDVESDLRRYVRRRVRRGHARGWGPYLVLAYGTAMTVGAFYFLSGGWAILAMLVIWLSTLGLYALMVLVGLTFTLVGAPGRLVDRLRDWRE